MELKYQEDEDSEIVCCSCAHNIRRSENNRIECYCNIDEHYIGYLQCMTNYCDKWQRSICYGDFSEG